MIIVDTINGVLLTEQELRNHFPETLFPAVLTQEELPPGYTIATQTQLPANTPAGYYLPDGYADTGSGWSNQWKFVPYTAQELAEQAAGRKQYFMTEAQTRLDTFAQTRGYDGILSACSYAPSTVPKFATEGQRCVLMRDQYWAALGVIFDAVIAGTRPEPATYAEIEPELPVLSWE
jgi:hypothetical protein